MTLSLVLIFATAGVAGWACDDENKAVHGKKEGCPISAAKTAERMAEGDSVELVGRVLCASCDMKAEGAHCNLVFQTEGDNQVVYSLVTNDRLAELTKVTSHGEKIVTVAGKTVSEDGKKLLSIEEFTVKG
jgi:hypothetical protein